MTITFMEELEGRIKYHNLTCFANIKLNVKQTLSKKKKDILEEVKEKSLGKKFKPYIGNREMIVINKKDLNKIISKHLK